MNRKLIAALGLGTALAFAMPTLAITPVSAATTYGTSMKKPATHHHAMCKATKTHKCPTMKTASKSKKK
ncbi:MAG: hypothetical protein ACJ8AS_08740 [Hyphomicrobiales bacterium]